MKRPTFADVLEARRTIAPYLRPTPRHAYPALSGLLGAEVRLKHENHQVLGAFKVRGGINLLAHLRPYERSRGVITASTGNHGQSIAFACKTFGARATVGLPVEANPLKVQSMRDLGAELIFHGKNFDEAREYCEGLAAEKGYRFVHPANEPLLIAGVATQTLEIVEEFPQVDAIFVPLGGGSGAAGHVSWPRPSTQRSRSSQFRRPVPRRDTYLGRTGALPNRPWRRWPRVWQRVGGTSCPRASCGTCWTTSCWSATTRSSTPSPFS